MIVSPACAGMDPWERQWPGVSAGFPRMRGDGPRVGARRAWPLRFPPHARGWTPNVRVITVPNVVSPACAGMDPYRAGRAVFPTRFPRMRGDGPDDCPLSHRGLMFPPHARGWARRAQPWWTARGRGADRYQSRLRSFARSSNWMQREAQNELDRVQAEAGQDWVPVIQPPPTSSAGRRGLRCSRSRRSRFAIEY